MVRQKLLSKPTCCYIHGGPTGFYTEKLKYSDVIIISGCPRLRPRAGCTQPRHKSPPCRTTSITAPDWGGQKTRYVSNIEWIWIFPPFICFDSFQVSFGDPYTAPDFYFEEPNRVQKPVSVHLQKTYVNWLRLGKWIVLRFWDRTPRIFCAELLADRSTKPILQIRGSVGISYVPCPPCLRTLLSSFLKSERVRPIIRLPLSS